MRAHILAFSFYRESASGFNQRGPGRYLEKEKGEESSRDPRDDVSPAFPSLCRPGTVGFLQGTSETRFGIGQNGLFPADSKRRIQ